MKSSWKAEILAICRKELRSELRNRSALSTSLLLSICTVFTLAFSLFGTTISSEASSGMFMSALLFAGVGTLARTFLSEEEQGTGDLLRLWSRPHAVYWGKVLFAFGVMSLTSLTVSLVFFVLTNSGAGAPGLLAVALLGVSAALASLVTLISGLVARGKNRGTLVGVLALPLLVPLIMLGVEALRAGMDGERLEAGWTNCGGIWLYTLLVLSTAPHQFAAAWSEQ